MDKQWTRVVGLKNPFCIRKRVFGCQTENRNSYSFTFLISTRLNKSDYVAFHLTANFTPVRYELIIVPNRTIISSMSDSKIPRYGRRRWLIYRPMQTCSGSTCLFYLGGILTPITVRGGLQSWCWSYCRSYSWIIIICSVFGYYGVFCQSYCC